MNFVRSALWRITTFAGGLFLASLIVFSLFTVVGGDAAAAILGQEATPETLAALRSEMGLDRPVHEQYLEWMSGFVRGDLGESFISRRSIAGEILQRVEVTVPLAFGAMSLVLLIALPMGYLAAVRNRTTLGAFISLGSQIGISFPAFWLALLFAILFGIQLGWLPVGGFPGWSEDFWGSIRSLILPALSLALISGSVLTRYVRTSVLEVLNEPYVQVMARAKGLTTRQALIRHGARNALIPVLTVAGIQFGTLLGGTIVIENVFFLPGLGRLLLTSVELRDIQIVQSVAVILAAMVLTLNLITDLLYMAVDPRMRTRS